MSADIISILERPGRCRTCASDAWTIGELNLHPGQVFQCYVCFDVARFPGWGIVPDRVIGQDLAAPGGDMSVEVVGRYDAQGVLHLEEMVIF